MTTQFIAEIRMFAGNFAPAGWALCNGQILSIANYQVLYSIIGLTYGGDGMTTFALPNLQGRVPLHVGQGPGLSDRRLGEIAGEGSETILTSMLPSHSHDVFIGQNAGSSEGPANAVWAGTKGRRIGQAYNNDSLHAARMHGNAIGSNGGGAPHNNMQPFLAINFIIALEGIFPSMS
jgi:microcystin-dependent protein